MNIPVFYIFLSFVIIQRLIELVIAKRNQKWSLESGGYEIDRRGYFPIVVMHTLFFIFMVSEFNFLNREINSYWFIYFSIFIAAQGLRYWVIITLGKQWNTRIIVIPGAPRVLYGPFTYIRHPNYLAVVMEIFSIPMIFSCYFTALIFSVINIFVLKRRIRIEEEALKQLR